MTSNVIEDIRKKNWYREQIVHLENIPSREPSYGRLHKPLSEEIEDYLETKGIRLYIHQANAINKIRSGRNVVITTSAASGKTLAFNIPVFEELMKDNNARALYLYPLKALTNDQLQVIYGLEDFTKCRARPKKYDGDTPQHERPSIRENSRIILSNPYAIHEYLPWHHKWRTFFQNLRFLVIDEAHVYRGVFGSNVAMLIRRLFRICEHYDSNPQIIMASATIANPNEHAEKLTGKKFEVVGDDGSGKGKKTFVFWNPPFIDKGNVTRRSPHQETRDLFVYQVGLGLQTLCFTVSRQMAELITRWSREDFRKLNAKLGKSITTYRAGYLPEERREIEAGLRSGKLNGVVSTTALELGIDIGSLDSVIISGYPGTVISTWQQAGRAGRGMNPSLVTLVAFENPLDQYFMRHPELFFSRPHENAIIDVDNPYVTSGHVLCASAELPLSLADKKYFGKQFDASLKVLDEEGLLKKTQNGWVYSGTSRAVDLVNLSNISSEVITVMCNGEIMETMDLKKAYNEAHEDAVLLHRGETYLVKELDLKQKIATVIQKDVDYYTEPLKDIDIEIKKTFSNKNVGTKVTVGEVNVTENHYGYVLKKYDRVIGRRTLDLPPLNYDTVAVWFTVEERIKKLVQEKGLDFSGGIHAVEHAMIGLTPLYALCDRWDVGGISTPMHTDTEESTIFIYDGYQGGIGISEKLYEIIDKMFSVTLQLIQDCPCEEGCPSCIYSPKCGNENKPLDKKVAVIILKEILKKVK